MKRVVGFGAEHSDLGSVFEDVVAATENIVTPDPMPEEKAFVRSDHYAFVKKGVPALAARRSGRRCVSVDSAREEMAGDRLSLAQRYSEA